MESYRSGFVRRAFFAFVIATVLFVFAFWAGSTYSYYKYQDVNLAQESVRYSLLGLDLEREILSSSCDLVDYFPLSKELDEMGSVIGLLEKKHGKYDERVMAQKKIYSVLQVQHMLSMRTIRDGCGKDVNIIMFFYSNQDSYKDEADLIGSILNYLKTSEPEGYMIYSFDYAISTSLLDVLKLKYGVDEPNVVVLNEDIVLSDVDDVDDVLDVLDN